MAKREFSKRVFTEFIRANGLELPVYEHRFHPTRKWRFDIAWVDSKVAIEVQGGIWTKGRHSRGKGQLNDMEKFNNAQLLGWTLFLVTPQQLMTQETINLLLNAP